MAEQHTIILTAGQVRALWSAAVMVDTIHVEDGTGASGLSGSRHAALLRAMDALRPHVKLTPSKREGANS